MRPNVSSILIGPTNFMKRNCKYCKKTLKLNRNNRANLYCNLGCYQLDRRRRFKTECGSCHKNIVKLKSQKRPVNFCSNKCRAKSLSIWQEGERHPNYRQGKSAYRNLALKYFKHVCSNKKCPIDFEIPVAMLDVHHKDGKRSNNKLSKLEFL